MTASGLISSEADHQVTPNSQLATEVQEQVESHAISFIQYSHLNSLKLPIIPTTSVSKD
jgi:hypothetical protein